MKFSEIKPNPNNPRIIKDDKFKKLVQSLKDFPQMMELRPIIIDEQNIIQGGNMRFKALLQLGYKEVPDEWIKQGKDLTEDQWREFVIKDNVGFGEWDWEELANEWDYDTLKEWGVDIPDFSNGHDINNKLTDEDVDINEEFDPIGELDGKQRVVFLFDCDLDAEKYLRYINISEYSKKGSAWQVNMSTQSI